MMIKNKILAGSILSAFLILAVSMTSVIGTERNTIRESPLFITRLNSYITQEEKTINYEYMGKEQGETISLPEKTELQQLIFDIINFAKNDDKEKVSEIKERLEKNPELKDNFILHIANNVNPLILATTSEQTWIECLIAGILILIMTFFYDCWGITAWL